jgi:D-glycero-alpha-D-manno-heptose-7-phosphate kinase
MDKERAKHTFMNLDIFIVLKTMSLREALQRIESNHHGTIFIVNPNGSVLGVATDGDIRRYLLNGGSLDHAIGLCANTDFVWERLTTPRENLLKKLDHRIRVIPLLDDSMCLVGVASRDYMPVQVEGAVYSRARAPVRISFGGGGSDLTHYFSGSDGGAVINSTISLYSHATLRLRNDCSILITSLDLGEKLEATDLESALSQSGRFRLIQALLRVINPDFGFELSLHSDFPLGSGLGGSAVVSAAVLGCFNQFRRDRWDPYEIAELAYQAERHYLGVAGGWQDQYATVFGGFNFMEFRMDQNLVHPLRIHPDILLELEESLVLCDTKTTHNSGEIHVHQRKQMASNEVRQLVESNVKLSYEMRNNLLRGRLLAFGQLMDKAWRLKRQISEKISSEHLDRIYDQAVAHGAVGGKLLGAGGGGFFLFYVPPFKKYDLISCLSSIGFTVRDFRFEQEGLKAWSVRESRNNVEHNKI